MNPQWVITEQMTTPTLQPHRPIAVSPIKRIDAQLSVRLMPLLRVGGIAAGVAAFGAAILALLGIGDAAPLLTAAGGLGALAFGVGQVHNQLSERQAAVRRARVTARLARRSLVEMVNSVEGILMVTWIDAIGSSRSLDPIQQFLRELVDLTAPLSGWQADAAERAMSAFLIAADRINGLKARLPPKAHEEFDGKDLAMKGRILGALIAAIDSLLLLGSADTDEPPVKDKVVALAESLDRWFGVLDS